MINNKQYDMVTKKNNNLKILEEKGKISLKYKHKLVKKTVKRKNKAGTINTFYSTYMPPEIIDYFKIQDSIFFYKGKDKQVYITSRRPTIEHQEIKLQQTNQFSVPTSFFNNLNDFDEVVLLLDFSKVDEYKNGMGLLSISLV